MDERRVTTGSSNDVFKDLMTSDRRNGSKRLPTTTPNQTIKATEKVSNRRGGKVRRSKSVPFYKILEGTTISVDAFKYGKIPGVTAYFLSHAHSDHYTNLNSGWKNGLIYCSLVTANLIKLKLGVNDQWIRVLTDDHTCEVDGVRVTLIDANHCPGSSLFLFEGFHEDLRPFRYLHCGDFRASPVQLRHPALLNKRIDICYLDTTYLDPKYCFPPQDQAIDACVEMVRSRVLKRIDPSSDKPSPNLNGRVNEVFSIDGSILVLVGTYSIGKERILKSIAKALRTKIYCDHKKSLIFKSIEDDELNSMITNNPLEAQVHVCIMFCIRKDMLEKYLDRFRHRFSQIIGIRPTGWSFKTNGTTKRKSSRGEIISETNPSLPKLIDSFRKPSDGSNPEEVRLYPSGDSNRVVQCFGVPYSEHSSFYELTCFCVSMDCERIIPTVNCGSASSREKMKYWIDKFKGERSRRIKEHGGSSCFIEPRSESYW
ncbi:DNA repair metallo-beta-lactamase-domain-containing protein [Phakopsora pachyrhizi]|nr:DNA repair metallo-beta-lactamase-domain-containing protein [Phakopsora pachyrhizi]